MLGGVNLAFMIKQTPGQTRVFTSENGEHGKLDSLLSGNFFVDICKGESRQGLFGILDGAGFALGFPSRKQGMNKPIVEEE